MGHSFEAFDEAAGGLPKEALGNGKNHSLHWKPPELHWSRESGKGKLDSRSFDEVLVGEATRREAFLDAGDGHFLDLVTEDASDRDAETVVGKLLTFLWYVT